MTTTLQQRSSASLWEQFCQWVTSTENRLYMWLVRRVDDPHSA
jgi:photosystem II P680 reaction center D1 protein